MASLAHPASGGEGAACDFHLTPFAEVRQIADRVTIFRNGSTVSTYDTANIDDQTIMADMLGRRMDRLYPERILAKTNTVALSVRGLALHLRVRKVDLDLYEGEIWVSPVCMDMANAIYFIRSSVSARLKAISSSGGAP